MVEKVTALKLRGEIYFDVREVEQAGQEIAYRVSDGEIIKNRKEALRRQSQIDLNDKVDMFMKEELPSETIASEQGNYVVDMVGREKVRYVLRYYDQMIRGFPWRNCY